MITGTSGRSAFALGKSSRPLIPGMLMLALIVAIGISLIFLLALAAFTADEEINHRERRNERDLDMRRRWP